MFVPQHAVQIMKNSTALDSSRNDPTGGYVPGGWSSLIGIVCALIGNVLISFALNTQRYAHLRLAREAGEISSITEAVRAKSESRHQKITYGTIQEDIADERARKNAEPVSGPILDHNDVTHEEDHDMTERDALIPQIEEPTSDASSESTIRGNEKQPEQRKKKNYLSSPWWWAGIVLMTIGEAGNFLAYGFAPASIVSPLGVVALISNCIIAPIMLKERFRARDLLGVIIAVGGAVTVVVSAKVNNPKLGPHEIGDLLKRWEFLTYFGITCGTIIVLMFLSNKYGERTVVIDIGVAGLLGGYTALSTKGVASLLSYRPLYILTFPIAYLLVAVLVSTAVLQIKYINRALQRFDSTIVIPTQFVFFTISVIVGSAMLYRDFEKTTADKLGEFFGGVALTFLGVWCITGGRTRQHDKVEDLETAEHHEEEEISLVNEEDTIEDTSSIATPIPRRTSDRHPSETFEPTSSTDSSLSYVTASTGQPATSPPKTGTGSRRQYSSISTRLAPPPLATTHSTPLIPGTTTSKSKRSRSAQPNLPEPEDPSTPRRPGAHRHISDISFSPLSQRNSAQTPQQAQTLKPPMAARHPSIVERIFPSGTFSGSFPRPSLGPLTSSLGPLSVVVADSMRGLPRDPGAMGEVRDGRSATATGTRRSTRGRSGRRPSAIAADTDANGTRRSSAVIVEEGGEDYFGNDAVAGDSRRGSRRKSRKDSDDGGN